MKSLHFLKQISCKSFSQTAIIHSHATKQIPQLIKFNSRRKFSSSKNFSEDSSPNQQQSEINSKSEEDYKKFSASLLDQFNLLKRTENRVFIEGYATNLTYISKVNAESVAHKGPVLLLPDLVLSWKGVTEVRDIYDIEKYSILKVLSNINIVLIGAGDIAEYTPEFFKFVDEFRKKYKIPIEVMKTTSAIGTFNFVNEEDRGVAGFFFPVQK